jgi:hypothetical protein
VPCSRPRPGPAGRPGRVGFGTNQPPFGMFHYLTRSESTQTARPGILRSIRLCYSGITLILKDLPLRTNLQHCYLVRVLSYSHLPKAFYCRRTRESIRSIQQSRVTPKWEVFMNKAARNLIPDATLPTGLIVSAHAGPCTTPVPPSSGISRG